MRAIYSTLRSILGSPEFRETHSFHSDWHDAVSLLRSYLHLLPHMADMEH